MAYGLTATTTDPRGNTKVVDALDELSGQAEDNSGMAASNDISAGIAREMP